MICKNCNTEFDTGNVKPGENAVCPCCGKIYKRKAESAKSPAPEPAEKASPKPKKEQAKVPFGALLVVLGVAVLLVAALIIGLTVCRSNPGLSCSPVSRTCAGEQAALNESYALKSYAFYHYEQSWNQEYSNRTEYRYYANGLLQTERLINEGTSDSVYEYSYIYNNNGFPTTVTRTSSYGYTSSFYLDPVYDDDNILNVFFLDEENRIMLDFYSYSPLFSNAYLISEGFDTIEKEFTDGEKTYEYELTDSLEKEWFTERNPDGSRTESTTCADANEGEHRNRISITFGPDNRILSLSIYQAEIQTGIAAVTYFREQRPDESESVLHGIVTDAAGSLESLLGEDIVRYLCSKDGTIVREDRYILGIVDTGSGRWLVKENPARQTWFDKNGKILQEDILFYYDDGTLFEKETYEYAPLSELTDHPGQPAAAETEKPAVSDAPKAADNASAPTDIPASQTKPVTDSVTSAPTQAPTAVPTAVSTDTPKPTATPTPKPTATPEPKAATILHCNNAANVRSQPDSGSTKLGSLSWGKHVTVIGRIGDWCMIEYKGGIGYVFSEYVAIHRTGTIVKVNNRVTVREAPDEESERLGAINKGKNVEVIDIFDDWAMILYKGDIAYVHSKFVELND